jgi:hypothetical protein
MGELKEECFRADSYRRMKLEFHGSKITSEIYGEVKTLGGVRFPWRWDGGMIFTKLRVIWEMSVKNPCR